MGVTMVRSSTVGEAAFKIRLTPELKWRLAYYARSQSQPISVVLRSLINDSLGEMDADECEAFRRWRNGEPAVARQEPPRAVPPATEEVSPEPPAECPQCHERKVPITGEPLWMNNPNKRVALCNNCRHKVSY